MCTDKILSESYLSLSRSFSYPVGRVQRKESSIAWISKSFKKPYHECLPVSLVISDHFPPERAIPCIFSNSQRAQIFGWAVYPAGKSKQTKSLKFPLILFVSPTPYFLFCTAQKWKVHLWKVHHLGLAGCHYLLWPFVLFLQSAREALKLCQLCLSCLPNPVKSGILLFDDL